MPESEEENAQCPVQPRQAVLYPAVTWDYRLTSTGKHGFGLVAARNIRKGELIYSDSIEFSCSDVVDGDCLLLDRYQKASRKSKNKNKLPQYFPLTRNTLLQSHGVPNLIQDPTGASAGTVSWLLEVPGMFMNHSCDPNTSDYPPCNDSGEGYAARDIPKGEELTCDYVLQFYDSGPLFDECTCGAEHCRGSMMGFKALSDDEKERLLPAAAQAVQALHLADIGKGPPVKREQEESPVRTLSSTDGIPAVVFPGPSHRSGDLANIRDGKAIPDLVVKRNDAGEWGLYIMKNIAAGDTVYDFWRQSWPVDSMLIDMVFAKHVNQGDPTEGTVIRFNALECATRDRNGRLMFSGWDMLRKHSCEPNVVYDYEYWDEEEDWCRTYAARDITAGEQITADFNTLFWDRSECVDLDLDTCHCGSKTCTGTVKGFKFLSPECKTAYKLLSKKHVPPLYDRKDEQVHSGEAVAPYVRVQWRMDDELGGEAPETDSDDSSSSADS